MFLKIYKHAFLRSLKTGIILGVISLASALFAGILYKVLLGLEKQDEMAVSILMSASGILYFVANVAVFLQFALAINDFRKAVATDEAYLTYTLPASDKEQFWARYLALFTWLAIALVLSNLVNYMYFVIIGDTNAKLWVLYLFTKIRKFEDFIICIEIVLAIAVVCASIVASFMSSILQFQALGARFNDKLAVFIMAGIYFVETFVFFVIFIFMLVITLNTGNTGLHVWIWSIIAYFGAIGGLNMFFSRKIMGRWLNLV